MAAEAAVFAEGEHVTVRGLAKAAQYNDQPGVIRALPEDGRYQVYLTNLKKTIRVKHANLTLRSRDTDSKEDVSSSSTRPTPATLPTPDVVVVAGAGTAEANSSYTLEGGEHAGKSRWTSSEGWTLEWTELDGGTWWLCDSVIGRYAAASSLHVPPPSGWETCKHLTVGSETSYSIDDTHGQDPTPKLTYSGSDRVGSAQRRPQQKTHPNGATKSSTSANQHKDRIVPGTRGASVPGGVTAKKGKKRLKSEKRLKNLLDREGYDVSNFIDTYGTLSNKVIENYIQIGKNGDFSFHLGSRKAD